MKQCISCTSCGSARVCLLGGDIGIGVEDINVDFEEVLDLQLVLC